MSLYLRTCEDGIKLSGRRRLSSPHTWTKLLLRERVVRSLAWRLAKRSSLSRFLTLQRAQCVARFAVRRALQSALCLMTQARHEAWPQPSEFRNTRPRGSGAPYVRGRGALCRSLHAPREANIRRAFPNRALPSPERGRRGACEGLRALASAH